MTLASVGIPDETLVRNIIATYHEASETDRSWGMAWYPLARVECANLCPDDLLKAAGVIAALSPQKQWRVNLAIAADSFELGHGTGSFEGQNAKATAILEGTPPLEVLGKRAYKSRAFYCAILAPLSDICTVVDRHAHDIAIGRRLFDSADRRLDRKGIYFQLDRAYRKAAVELDIPLHTLQATTWIAWRRIHGVEEPDYEEEW